TSGSKFIKVEYEHYTSAQCAEFNNTRLYNAINSIEKNAPATAAYLKSTDKDKNIPILIATNLTQQTKALGEALRSNWGAIIDKAVFEDPKKLASTMLHETTHMRGGSEFSAWSATVAAGYISGEQYLNQLQVNWSNASVENPGGHGYMTAGMTKELQEKVASYCSMQDSDEKTKFGQEILKRVIAEGNTWNRGK
ncbi:MAG: hypothetical protein LWX56_04985, partial [Ignavibacteria bacterium]|nr:hypothetical protein [Ignavibacteria bacterium]